MDNRQKKWLVNAEGTLDDGTDVFYHYSYKAQDAAEAWRIFSANLDDHVNFYRISVTEVVKRNE